MEKSRKKYGDSGKFSCPSRLQETPLCFLSIFLSVFFKFFKTPCAESFHICTMEEWEPFI